MDFTSQPNPVSVQSAAYLFQDGGEMGEMIRRYNWEAHPLGNPASWPLSLKTGIRIMLHSKHPIFIWWTKEMYMFHNDAYVPLMGNKHPEGLGAKGYQVWAETWPQLGAVLEGILKGDEAFYGEELEVPMNRKGYMDETYWTFSYSAMPDDEGKVNGIFCACNEVTESVLARRRLKTVKNLSEAITGQPTLAKACEKACQILGESTQDIPYSLVYLLDEKSQTASLAAQSGNLPASLTPSVIHLQMPAGETPWPLATVWQKKELITTELPLQSADSELRPDRAAIIPVNKPGDHTLYGFLVVGLSRRLEYTEVYMNFHQMLAAQIAATLAALQAHGLAEQQRARLQDLFMQAPAPICILGGQALVYEFVNPAYAQLFPGRALRGKPIAEAVPEIARSQVGISLQEVYHTGKTHEEKEMLIQVASYDQGLLEDRYFRYILQARYDLSGNIDGVVVFALEITEQVMARRKVEASARQLRLITDALPVLIGYLDKEEKYRFANQAYETWFNHAPEWLLGRPVREVVGEKAYSGVKKYIDRALAGERIDFEAEMPYREDFKKIIRTSYVPDYQQGEVAGFYTLVNDITEQVEARREVDRQRQQLNDLFMQAPAPIVILNGPAFVFELVNPAYQQIFSGRQLLGKPLLDAVPELAGSPVVTILENVYTTGHTSVAQEMPLLLAREEGAGVKEYYWTFIYQARRTNDGTINGILVFAHEVTAQVKARQLIENNARQFQLLLESIPQITWMAEPDGNVIFYNSRWYDYTGLDFEESKAMGWAPVVHPQDMPMALDALTNSISTGEGFQLELRLKRKEGQVYRWFLSMMLPLKNEQGTLSGWVGTSTDIHEKKQLEEDLQRSKQELAAANEELQASNYELSESNRLLSYINADMDNFIYTASHDLKAPINNIEGLMKALLRQLPQESLTNERTSRTIDYILEAVERFKRTIANLTEIVKLQKENNLPATTIDLKKLLEEVQLDLAPLIRETNAQVEIDVEACPEIVFSEKNLRSILYNLLSNAVKYHSPDRQPMVQVSCKPEEAYLLLTVQDNGLGMDLSREGKLFSMFTRFHSHVEGSGIGLYMVKKIIENAGGSIQVESELGRGSTFRVYFRK